MPHSLWVLHDFSSASLQNGAVLVRITSILEAAALTFSCFFYLEKKNGLDIPPSRVKPRLCVGSSEENVTREKALGQTLMGAPCVLTLSLPGEPCGGSMLGLLLIT